MMKTNARNFAFFPALFLMGALMLNADDTNKEQILKLFPQADTNGDGVLSDSEEEAVFQKALKRFPNADKNRDGVLSEAEKRIILRQVAKRAKTGPSATGANPTRKVPSFANVKYGEHERQVFDIWLADSSKANAPRDLHSRRRLQFGSKDKLKADQLSQLLDSGISGRSYQLPLPDNRAHCRPLITTHGEHCSLCVPKQAIGTSTKAKSPHSEVLLALKFACGWRSPMTWRTPIVPTQSKENQLG
jgi:hypothetical protein